MILVIRGTVLSISTKTCKYDESSILNSVTSSSLAAAAVSSNSNNAISTPKFITVLLEKLYKGYTHINSTRGTTLTIQFASPFSVPLRPGRLYLLSGYLIDGQLHMNDCSWYQVWAYLTLTQYHGLRRYYWIYCACKVKYCYNGYCQASGLRSCDWSVPNLAMAAKKQDCNSKYNVCMVRDGRCRWHNPKAGRKCYVTKTTTNNIP